MEFVVIRFFVFPRYFREKRVDFKEILSSLIGNIRECICCKLNYSIDQFRPIPRVTRENPTFNISNWTNDFIISLSTKPICIKCNFKWKQPGLNYSIFLKASHQYSDYKNLISKIINKFITQFMDSLSLRRISLFNNIQWK